MSEEWTPEDITLYWEWCEVWYDPSFDFRSDLNDVGEEMLAKAERIGPPDPSTRPDNDDPITDSYITW